jgi:2-iminoacetate synthase ThiH
MAVSRLMLDNFAHIKAYWVMLGKRLAQVALHFGANDIDGTITEGGELTESYSVESNNEVKMTRPELIQLIEEAGFEAVERGYRLQSRRKGSRSRCDSEEPCASLVKASLAIINRKDTKPHRTTQSFSS